MINQCSFSNQQSEKGGAAVTTVIKKSGAENRLMEFFPSINQQQTEENFAKTFLARDLPEVVAFRKQVLIHIHLYKNSTNYPRDESLPMRPKYSSRILVFEFWI